MPTQRCVLNSPILKKKLFRVIFCEAARTAKWFGVNISTNYLQQIASTDQWNPSKQNWLYYLGTKQLANVD